MVDIQSAGVLLFRKFDKPEFLLMQHADRWDLPKGHLDPGETLLQCAVRELEEETGIGPAIVQIADDFVFEHEYTVRQKRHGNEPRLKQLVIYLGWLTQDSPIVITEHIGFQWYNWNPPHKIQEKTIDPLLQAVATYFESRNKPAD